MPIDHKYGRVTTEHGSIRADEPVVVFRAQDRLLPKLLKVYRYFCELAGSPEHHLAALDESVELVKAWQADHYTRTPNSNEWAARTGRDA